MDRKSLAILVVSFVLLMLWYPLTNRLFPPVPKQTNAPALGTNSGLASTNLFLAGTNGVSTAVVSTNMAAPPAAIAPAEAMLPPAGPEETLEVERGNALYTFTSHGGGLKEIALKEYPATLDRLTRGKKGTNGFAKLNTRAAVPMMVVHGSSYLQEDGVFRLSEQDGKVRAEKGLSNGLYWIKEFQISTNYLIKVSARLENRSQTAIGVPSHEWVIGTATPVGQRDESIALGFQWYNGKKAEDISEPWFRNRTLGCLPGTPRSEYISGDNNVYWGAVHNQFFTMIAVPNEPAPRITGRPVTLAPPMRNGRPETLPGVPPVTGFQTAFLYGQSVLAPGQALERHYDLYAGPKEYNTLSRLKQNVDLVMGFSGFFGFFAKALLLSMNGLHGALHLSYGITIIIITIIIKVVFFPLTQASTRSMKRMAALQPQMKALQEKYKDDPKKMQMKLLEFMRENKVSPLGGCIPMLLQIPVFIGFYKMLQSAIELRGASFLWAFDLSQPDTVAYLGGFPLNPLPLVMGATMLWQSHLTPPSPGIDPVQQKIMKYMPLMFLVMLYNFSAGLTLYWTVQNLLTIAQLKLTRSTEPLTPAPGKPAVPAPKAPAPGKKRK